MLTCCLSCSDYPAHDIDRDREWFPGANLRTCCCVQLNLHQAVCTSCEWHHITDTEQEAVEAWHEQMPPIDAAFLKEHKPSRWRSFTTDEAVLRCCGQDFGPVSKRRKRDTPDARDEWADHVAAASAKQEGVK